jgi:PhnB protein
MTNASMTVQAYVFFNGRCEEALNFYRGAIGAEVQIIMRVKDGPEPQPGRENKIMHATMTIGETLVMASDGRADDGPKFDGFALAITVPNESEAERVFAALSEGGKVTMPLSPTFWAPKFGMTEDRFGIGWMVSVQHKP